MQDLAAFRSQIDQLDHQLLQVLAKRFNVVQQIADWKQSNGHEARDVNRYKNMVNERKQWAAALGVSEEFLAKLLYLIHEESVRVQKEKFD